MVADGGGDTSDHFKAHCGRLHVRHGGWVTQGWRPHEQGHWELSTIVVPGGFQGDLRTACSREGLQIMRYQCMFPLTAGDRVQHRGNCIGEIARPVALRDALPVTQTWTFVGGEIPVTGMDIRMDDAARPSRVVGEAFLGGRPQAITRPVHRRRNECPRFLHCLLMADAGAGGG